MIGDAISFSFFRVFWLGTSRTAALAAPAGAEWFILLQSGPAEKSRLAKPERSFRYVSIGNTASRRLRASVA
ncbi:hypothetical protein ACSBOB_17625 [Mesorhizobium sp. ASY16-5R]|uniref:hypothetical protein n=1 Tax=Mesorhizobium sp. ASY16-5R TaxID=3445772 RepID=UPI003FA093DA